VEHSEEREAETLTQNSSVDYLLGLFLLPLDYLCIQGDHRDAN